jgi:hypothetical protein
VKISQITLSLPLVPDRPGLEVPAQLRCHGALRARMAGDVENPVEVTLIESDQFRPSNSAMSWDDNQGGQPRQAIQGYTRT